MCTTHNIPTSITIHHINSGWCNKPEGILQILYESVWINTALVKNPQFMRYWRKGKKEDTNDDTDLIKEECRIYSLTPLLLSCKYVCDKKKDIE